MAARQRHGRSRAGDRVGGVALVLVPARESPEAHTVSFAPAGRRDVRAAWFGDEEVGGQYVQHGEATLTIGWDKRFADIIDAATARAMLQVEQEAVQRAWDSAHESDAAPSGQGVNAGASGWPAWYQDERNADARVDLQLLSALSRDVTAASVAPDEGVPVEPARHAKAEAPVSADAATPVAEPPVATTSSAEPASRSAPAGAEPNTTGAKPARFTISRDQSAQAQGLLQALRERAATGDWAGVQQLRETYAQSYGLPDSLAVAKWDARIALALGRPEAALTALAPYATAFDDEGARLHAVSLLRTGDATSAVGVYRALLSAHPDDAQLWLGLGMALEASHADSEAIKFAYGQSLQLAGDAALRQVAQAHLDAHQA